MSREDRSENEPLNYEPAPLTHPRGQSREERLAAERARCLEHQSQTGGMGHYFDQWGYPPDRGGRER